MLSKLSITLMVTYPFVAYITLWLERPLFIIGYLLLILSLIAINKCRNKHWYFGLSLLAVIVLITYMLQGNQARYLAYLPPILIIFSLFILFSQSLLAGQTPLITRYARILGDTLEERHLRYNRALTLAWALFFLLLAMISILLAIFGSVESWSLFTYMISYLLIGSFFIIEFYYRKRHFSGEIEGGFFQFMRKLIKIKPHNLTK